MTASISKNLVALRAAQIAGPTGLLPISLASWWAGVASGHYPAPIRLSPKVTVWTRAEIMSLVARSYDEANHE